MNIKSIYPYLGVSAVLSVAFRFLQIMLGTDSMSGLRNTDSPFSWLFILVIVLSSVGLYIIPKLSYGIGKVTDIQFGKLIPLCAILSGLGCALDAVRLIPYASTLFLKIELVLGLLAAVSLIIFGGILLKKLPEKLLIMLIFPVLFYAVNLSKEFLSDILIATSPIASLILFKTIFKLLFYLELLCFFFKENQGEKIAKTLFISFAAVLITLCDLLPTVALTIAEPEKYSGLLSDPDYSDIIFIFFLLQFAASIVKAVIKKSKALKSKTIEE